MLRHLGGRLAHSREVQMALAEGMLPSCLARVAEAPSSSICAAVGLSKPILCSPFSHSRNYATQASVPAGAASFAEGPKAQRGWVLLLPAAFAAFLGFWQVDRRQWKIEQLKQRSSALQAEPVEIFQLPSTPAEYTRVACEGEFQHSNSIFVGPRPRTIMGTATKGYTLITPLVNREWNKAVLVNRGWVPEDWRDDPQMRQKESPSDEVQVVGIVRGSEEPSSFVPDNKPAKGEWYWIDVTAVAHACGLPPDTPLVEEISDQLPATQRGPIPTSMDVMAFKTRKPQQEGQYPIPRPAGDLMRFSVMPLDHRNYALTWFALSGATSLLAWRALRRPAKVPRS